MLTQTLAIFVDAYRELNARKLFWITLVISGVVVVAFAGVGINERGINAFGIFIGPWLTTSMVGREAFYKYVFAIIGVPIWLTWGATILALVSTAGIMPDFVSGGAVDVVLSKPIGRVRLYLTKYTSALMFVALQSLVFSGAVFLVIGVRGGAWEPRLLLAVPLVLCFFSFIYCVTAFVGLVTRSTIAALLGGVFFWLLVWATHVTESIYLTVKVQSEMTVTGLEALVSGYQQSIAALDAPPPTPAPAPEQAPAPEPTPPGAAAPAVTGGSIAGESAPANAGIRAALAEAARQVLAASERPGGEAPRAELERKLARASATLEEERNDLRSYRKGHAIALAVKSVLPKTAETTQLLTRSMLSTADIAIIERRDDRAKYQRRHDPDDPRSVVSDVKAAETVEDIVRTRPVWWVLGTSLLFEAVVVGFAARRFARRDF